MLVNKVEAVNMEGQVKVKEEGSRGLRQWPRSFF